MTHIIVETAKRWRLPLVCLAWMFTLLGLMMRGAYETFLADNFLPIIVLSMLIFLPLAFLALLRRTLPRFGVREALATAIILLPLPYNLRSVIDMRAKLDAERIRDNYEKIGTKRTVPMRQWPKVQKVLHGKEVLLGGE